MCIFLERMHNLFTLGLENHTVDSVNSILFQYLNLKNPCHVLQRNNNLAILLNFEKLTSSPTFSFGGRLLPDCVCIFTELVLP